MSARPIWISHRGLCQEYDENSLGSFKAAVVAGFKWIETDLRMTKDSHVVLIHDDNLLRISSEDAVVVDKTRKELESIVLKKSGSILFLDKFMSEFKDQSWVFDIKPETQTQTIDYLKKIILENPELLEKIIFLFWDHKAQHDFLSDFPQATCFAQEDECYRANIALVFKMYFLSGIKKNTVYSIPPKLMGLKLLTKWRVDKFHQLGAKALAYLPETQQEMIQSLDSGADYILSNHIPYLK